MKTCPFCAEEIREAAIKCKHCGSMLDGAPTRGGDRGERSASRLRKAVSSAADGTAAPRREIYRGHPSWRAYFRHYFFIAVLAFGGPWLGYHGARSVGADTPVLVGLAAAPAVVALVWFALLRIYRRSKIVRVTTTNIETEVGILSKRIDVLELWRCRDVAYHQSIFDRLLGISHVRIYTADVSSPELRIVGLPASRDLFERIRDSIEIQRQARNVMGFVD